LSQLSVEHRKKIDSKCKKGFEILERIKPKLEASYSIKAAAEKKAAAERAAAARTQQVRADARVNTIQQAEMELLEKRLLALGAKPDELPSAGLPPAAVADAAPVVATTAPVPATYANLDAPPSDVNSNKNAAIALSATAATAAVVATAAATIPSAYPALSPSTVGDVFIPSAIAPPPAAIAPPAPLPSAPPIAAPTLSPLPSAPPIAPPAGEPPVVDALPSAPPLDDVPAPKQPIVYSQLPSAPAINAAAVPSAPAPAAAAAPQRVVASMGGTHVRPVIMDGEILSDFMRLVHQNTARGIETCGVLTGKLESSEHDSGRFIVTHLILPRQKGTQNTCEMTDEDSLFDFQMKHDLMTLGWIHTHPTQSCFLSSVDLHTHLGYQLMLPEAVAIVMAPTDRRAQFGVFSLSEIGLDTIRTCQQKSFHVHRLPDADIYSNASHVRWRQGHPQYRLVDFR
jgi:proteasome lid subunit RPN8/RPN11